MSFPRPRRLRLPDSRRRCRRRSVFCPRSGLMPRARRLRHTPQLRAARGEAQLRREPWAVPGFALLDLAPRLRSSIASRTRADPKDFDLFGSNTSRRAERDRAHAVALTSRRLAVRRGSWGKHGFPHALRRGRDLNPRRTFQHVRDFQSRSLGHSDTSPCCEAEKEGFEPSMEAFTPITP